MKLSNEYIRGVGVGMVAAGIGAIILPGNAGYSAAIIGVCALVLGYALWDHERNVVGE